ncbi:MAG: metal-dependent transcriptional regulator [Actinomycetes bacterium]
METGYHTPLEEYLETIATLSDEGTEVIGARVAERMGRSAPAVKEMLDRLEEDGYIARTGRVIDLTDAGREVATTVTRRHRLAERLLVDVIGLEWHKVHDEAGRWEHVISADVEEKLVALLGDPGTCPHGNPIPGSANRPERPSSTLAEASPGDVVVLRRIGELVEHDRDVLVAMDGVSFTPGSSAEVLVPDVHDEVRLQATHGELVVSLAMARSLWIDTLESEGRQGAP